MNMDIGGTIIDTGKPEYSGENLSQCYSYFLDNSTQMDCSGIDM